MGIDEREFPPPSRAFGESKETMIEANVGRPREGYFNNLGGPTLLYK